MTHPYIEGLMSSGYALGGILCVMIVTIIYFIVSRYKPKTKGKKKTADADTDDTPIQAAISAIESAQKQSSQTSSKTPQANRESSAPTEDCAEGM